MRMKTSMSGLWEQAGSSSQWAVGMGVLEAVYLWEPHRACRVGAVSASAPPRTRRMRGGGLEAAEVGDPSALGGEEGACLCDETLPGEDSDIEIPHEGCLLF